MIRSESPHGVAGPTGQARRWRLRTTAVAGLLVAFAGGAVLVEPGAALAEPVTLTEVSQGASSYVLNGEILNDTSSPMTSWRVEFDLPDGTHATDFGSSTAKLTTAGQHFILQNRNPVSVAPGHSVGFGVLIVGPGSPANCVSNATACAFDTEPPTTTTNVRITKVTYPATANLLYWDASSDNMAVARYEVTRNGTTIAANASSPLVLPSSAMPGDVFGVRAYDSMGNASTLATVVLT